VSQLKFHVIVKLRQELPHGLDLPDWQHFIGDKSVAVEHIEPDVDRILAASAIRVWVTREYVPAGEMWSADERRHGLDRTYRLILQKDYQVPAGLVDEIRGVPAVEEARGLEVGATPLPRLATETSAMPQAADLIHLGYAKALTKGRRDVRVAVIDTGVDAGHPELQGKVVQQSDFVDLAGMDTTDFIGDIRGFDGVADDEVGHGTHVAGIIAARGLDMDEGVVPDCSIVAVRVLATMRRGSRLWGAGIVDNINPGIKFAVDEGKADVLNISLGIKNEGGGLPHADVIRYALSRNVTVVAASGNDGSPQRYYPGALPGVCAVGAVDGGGTVTNFTSYGANIMCVAPGMNIYSSFAHGTYATASGTSQASPFVAGSVAAMKSFAREQGARLDNEVIFDVLKRTSDKVDDRLHNQRAGYGVLNLADGFKYLTYTLNLN
jgi:subtilisin family serine protease